MKQLTAKKVMFVIQPQSIIDVITNSSSELFIFQGNDKQVIEGMISDVYPNYRDEYEELKSIEELDAYDMINYFGWIFERSNWNSRNWSYECIAPPGMDIADLTVLDESGRSWYKDNLKFSEEKIEANLDKIKEALKGTYLLYSLDDNPNWDMQEALWQIGERHHLG